VRFLAPSRSVGENGATRGQGTDLRFGDRRDTGMRLSYAYPRATSTAMRRSPLRHDLEELTEYREAGFSTQTRRTSGRCHRNRPAQVLDLVRGKLGHDKERRGEQTFVSRGFGVRLVRCLVRCAPAAEWVAAIALRDVSFVHKFVVVRAASVRVVPRV